MASIYKRDNPSGTKVWRAVIRINGHPTICNHFERKQEAEDWAADVEHKIKMGQFKLDQFKGKLTFSDLIDRYTASGALEHQKSADDTIRHLNYWKKRFKNYTLPHLTPELISKERKLLLDTPTYRGQNRSPSTVNRYMSSLSAIMSYAWRSGFTSENVCQKILKLKEPLGRDRVLSEEEASRLLQACKESKNNYLFCITLIGLTCGLRLGEILGLTWSAISFENQLALLRKGTTKNNRPRSIPLIPEVTDELKKLYEKRDTSKLLVFASKTAFGKLDIKKSWHTALKHAGLSNTGVVFHSLRHTFLTWSSSQASSVQELSCASGHRSLSALENYLHNQSKTVRKFGENIAAKILPTKITTEPKENK